MQGSRVRHGATPNSTPHTTTPVIGADDRFGGCFINKIPEVPIEALLIATILLVTLAIVLSNIVLHSIKMQ